ncbi:NADP-dependent oxidoreductase [Alkalicaulis satelles]|uniref:NADP-dependent oxidoreductase n=2 Tax=Alkalicaulis satelles TaxID=2609175 RepID=A0A5M6ZME4_9PROT|nr:NADP-dependent oxidoreductase [Alkalicaulis satelles]
MQQGVLRAPVQGVPQARDFALIDAPRPQCPEGGVVVRLSHVSMDPYVGARLRGRHMGEAAPEPMTQAIPGHGVGVVIESRCAIAEGAYVHLMEAGWRELAPALDAEVRVIEPGGLSPSVFLSSLGMPGLTAWAGMTQLARVRKGDCVLVDAAAGAVGGAAGQIARAQGAARVIGIAGGPQKAALVRDTYGFDACIDYRTDGWKDELAGALSGGLDVHFENVSSEILTLALTHMNPYGRAVLCGLAAHYHDDQSAPGVPFGLIIGKRASLHGLVVYDFYDRWDAFLAKCRPLVETGALVIAEDAADGLAAAPEAFERLMTGRNLGKALVKL